MRTSLGKAVYQVYEWLVRRLLATNTLMMYCKSGEKIRMYNCCSRPTTSDEGCVKGPHVFYESNPEDLHARHAFSHTRQAALSSATSDTALDIVALDCEMIYTTGGMRVARVSVVDGGGAEIFDEFVRMDDGVEVMCVPPFYLLYVFLMLALVITILVSLE